MVRSKFCIGLALLGFAGFAGCNPVVEVGAVEVAEGLDCYRWGVSVLRESRTSAQPDVVAFSGGDLYLFGTPGQTTMLKAQGRYGTDWVTAAGPDLVTGAELVDLEPWPAGGVIGLTGGLSGFDVTHVDSDGVFTRLAVLEFEKSGFLGEVGTHENGFVVAAVEGSDSRPTGVRIWSFDGTGQQQWTRIVPTTFTTFGNGSDRALAVRVDGDAVVTVAVADDSLADSSGAGGVRRVELDSDGTILAQDTATVSGTPMDIVFQDDGEVSVLSWRSDFVEIKHFDAELQTLWVAEPRAGEGIEAELLAWNPHTDRLLMLGHNRPSGGSSSGWYVVLDPDGNIEWQRTTGDRGAHIGVDPLGGFVVAEWRAELRLRQVLPTGCG